MTAIDYLIVYFLSIPIWFGIVALIKDYLTAEKLERERE